MDGNAQEGNCGMNGQSESTLVMVDDCVDEIHMTERRIRREGIVNRFESAQDPEQLEETLKKLEASGVDRNSFLILLDINMPRTDGFETLKALRSHSDYKDVPVLMLSGSDDEEHMFECFELGGNGYLVKPFSGDEFFSAVQNIPRIKKKILQ